MAKARDPLVLRGHTGDVVYAHFAPDGKTLLSLSDDHTLRRWDAATGEELGTLLKNVSNSYCKLSPDGKTLFVERGLLDLGTLEWRVLERIDYRSLQFSRDGRWLGEANGERVGLWDLGARKYQPVHQLHTARVDSVVLCPDGKTVASGSADKTVILYDLEAKKARAVIKAHPGPVEWVWVLPDGKTLASYSQSDPAVKFWDVATGADRGGLANDHNLKFVYYTADSPWMVVTVDQKDNAKVWDLAGGAAGDRKGGDR